MLNAVRHSLVQLADDVEALPVVVLPALHAVHVNDTLATPPADHDP